MPDLPRRLGGQREMSGTRFDVSQIRTIVVAMLENRSFDHAIGRLRAALTKIP